MDALPGRHSWPTVGGQATAAALCGLFPCALRLMPYARLYCPIYSTTFFPAMRPELIAKAAHAPEELRIL